MAKKDNTLRVYLQYPLGFPDCSYYKYLIQYPPRGVEFLNTRGNGEIITKDYSFKVLSKLKKTIRATADILMPGIPNTRLSPKGNYDLIHCTHCLSKNNSPWVADMEAYWQLWISSKKSIDKVRPILENRNCKKILPWTKKASLEIIKNFPSIKDKVETVYSACPMPKTSKKDEKIINLLFSGRSFFQKGGLHALEVIDCLTKKYNYVYGIINSAVPKHIINHYSKNKKLTFYPLLPQKEVFSLYDKSHILIYPGYTDSFGFAYLEAMSYGLPIITVDGDSRDEIVNDGITGFIISRPKDFSYETIGRNERVIIKDLIDKTSKVIEDKTLRKKMSHNCIKEIKTGKFSLKSHNEKLRRIYEEAIR